MLDKAWRQARIVVGLTDLHLHDLRHAGNTWAATTGASTKELMARMGHASASAALRYQHATADRDRAIAHALSGLARPAVVTSIPDARRVGGVGA
jgi:integrase